MGNLGCQRTPTRNGELAKIDSFVPGTTGTWREMEGHLRTLEDDGLRRVPNEARTYSMHFSSPTSESAEAIEATPGDTHMHSPIRYRYQSHLESFTQPMSALWSYSWRRHLCTCPKYCTSLSTLSYIPTAVAPDSPH